MAQATSDIRAQVSSELSWIQELIMKESGLNAIEAKDLLRDVITKDL